MSWITDGAGEAIDFNYFPLGQLVKRNEGVTHMSGNVRFHISASYIGTGQEVFDGLRQEVQTSVGQCGKITELKLAA